MTQSSVQGHVQEHVDLIAKHEQEFLEKRSLTEKMGDRAATFIGSLTYVALHVGLFAAWTVWNSLSIPGIRPFDPFPFQLLATCFGFEAILVASLILMRQSRMSRRAEERDHLMLQVLLLSEREITAVVGMERKIAEHLGLQKIAQDERITELSKQTSIEDVANTIKESLIGE